MCVVYMLDRLLGDLTVQVTGRPPPPKKRPSSVFFVSFHLAVTKHPEIHRSAFCWNRSEDWTGSWGAGGEDHGTMPFQEPEHRVTEGCQGGPWDKHTPSSL